MKLSPRNLLLALGAALAAVSPGLLKPHLHGEEKAATTFPTFAVQEIDHSLGVGYAVLLADVDGDGKPDLVVVDQTRVVWYQNPTWKQRTILQGQTRADNVCIAAADIDGDGKIDFALGADWKPFDTQKGGTLHWLSRGKTLEDLWTLHDISDDIPTIHRIRFADLDGTGKPALVVAPLMGRNSTKEKNWLDAPVRLQAFRIPKDPIRDRWTPETLDESLHVVHNFHPIAGPGKSMNLLTASYDGVHLLQRNDKTWQAMQLGTGNQETPNGSRGASEIKQGRLKDGTPFIATIEPWHGHQVVVYTPPSDPKAKDLLWNRHVLDDKLKWGHAVWCADLDGDGEDELIIGVRDNLSDKPGERCGVRVYKAVNAREGKWERHILDDGGIAVEDLAAGDLFGTGRVDIVAVGRATHNVRIYRNGGK
jgi:FG-GAP-like repeat